MPCQAAWSRAAPYRADPCPSMANLAYQNLALMPVEKPPSKNQEFRFCDRHQDSIDVCDEGAAVHRDVDGCPLVLLRLLRVLDNACITTNVRCTTKTPSAESTTRRANEDASALRAVALSVVDRSMLELLLLNALLFSHDYFSASHGTSGPPMFSKSMVFTPVTSPSTSVGGSR